MKMKMLLVRRERTTAYQILFLLILLLSFSPQSGFPDENIIDNPGFESGRVKGWELWGIGQNDVRIISEQKLAHSGKRVWRWNKRSPSSWAGANFDVFGDVAWGDTIYASAWVRMKARSSVKVFISITPVDQNGKKISPPQESEHLSGENDWTKLQVQYRVPHKEHMKDLKKLTFDLIAFQAGPDDEIFFDDLYVGTVPENAREEGQKRTSNVKPAPPPVVQRQADKKEGPSSGLSDAAFLDLVEKKAFAYFWYETDPKTGLTRDRARNFSKETSTKYASVAASGFALSAYVIGVERGWINKEQAIKRIRTTLDTFANGPVRNEKGFFPHFVDCATGEDAKDTEISTIDTVLFLAGMIIAREYFHQDREIRRLSDTIFNRVDWNWARNGHPHFVTHGLDADGEFIWAHWGSITEGLIIYLLGLGSSAHRLPASTWRSIERRWGEYGGYPFLVEETYQSMFRYLYPTLWYDLRGRLDSESNLSFFENATLAALAMREYALRQASEYPASYGPNMWGLSACDGPGNAYRIYGFPPGELASDSALPDGTVVVYAMAGCMPLLPQHTLRAMRHLFDRHQDAWGVYGFAGSLNPTTGFIAADVIGIDVGTILLAIENYRSGTLWKLFMQNQWIKSATQKIGWKTYPHSSQRSGPVDLARNYQWRFRAGEGDFTKADVDDSSWLEVVVPEYWEHIHPLYREFDGVGWYRVKFQVPAKRLAVWRTSHSSLVLRIGGVRNGDRCYLNGELIGETDAASSEADHPRTYPIRRGLLRGGDNVLAVRVENHHGLGGIWRTPVCIGPDV